MFRSRLFSYLFHLWLQVPSHSPSPSATVSFFVSPLAFVCVYAERTVRWLLCLDPDRDITAFSGFSIFTTGTRARQDWQLGRVFPCKSSYPSALHRRRFKGEDSFLNSTFLPPTDGPHLDKHLNSCFPDISTNILYRQSRCGSFFSVSKCVVSCDGFEWLATLLF